MQASGSSSSDSRIVRSALVGPIPVRSTRTSAPPNCALNKCLLSRSALNERRRSHGLNSQSTANVTSTFMHETFCFSMPPGRNSAIRRHSAAHNCAVHTRPQPVQEQTQQTPPETPTPAPPLNNRQTSCAGPSVLPQAEFAAGGSASEKTYDRHNQPPSPQNAAIGYVGWAVH